MQNTNIILDTKDISEESGPATEPVSLQEMKDYLRLEGLTDDSFVFDDDLIEEFITSARQGLEETLSVSLIDHTWEASGVTNEAGNIQLKYGPVKEVTEILNSSDEAFDTDDIKIKGDYLRCPRACNMTVTYTAGFDSVPKPLVTEIKRMVAYMYENRGETDGLGGYKYSDQALKFSRNPWLV